MDFPDYAIPTHDEYVPNHKSPYDVIYNSFSLRVGYAIRKHYPEDNNLEYQNGITYDVVCIGSDGIGPVNIYVYNRCPVASFLGSVADKQSVVLRTADVTDDKLTQDTINKSTKVLVLCINGRNTHGVIVACLPHLTNNDTLKKDGNNLQFEFNGINININKDGELKLLYKSPTAADSSPLDKNAAKSSGSYLQFAKDGSINLQTGGDSPASKINLTYQDILTVSNTKKIHLDTPAVEIGAASQGMVRGNQFRDDLSSFLNSLSNNLQDIALQLTQTGAVIGALTTALGMGPSGGQGLIQAALDLGKVIGDITKFEAGKSSHVSTKHKLE